MKAAFSPPPRPPPKAHAEPATDTALNAVPQPQFDEPLPPLQANPATEAELPISPTLLQPMDSRTVEEVQNKSSLAEPLSTSGGSDLSIAGSAPGPTTPDQPHIKEPQQTSSAETVDQDKSRSRSLSPVEERRAPRSRRQSRDASRSFDKRRSRDRKRADVVVGQSTLGSEDLEKIGGQDSLEVRQVHLGNGQVASLILEEGRLQRIVSSNGQIAELQWQPPPAQVRSQVPKQQLAVKMHRGVSPPQKEGSMSALPLPGSIKRWANSLNSQRLTSQSEYGSDLFTAPVKAGTKAKSTADVNRIRSVDMSRPAQRKGFSNSLLSLPTGKVYSKRDAASVDSRPGVNGDWNPMHETWLPQNMTAEQTAAQNEGAEAAKREARKRTTSVDSGLLYQQSRFPSSNKQTSFSESPTAAGPTPVNVDSLHKSGEIEKKQGKQGLWSSLKRILHIPSVPKSQPGTPNPSATPTTKRSSKGRFSFSGNKKTAPAPASVVAEKPVPEAGRRRNRSMSNSRPTSAEYQPGTDQKARSRSTSTSQALGGYNARMADRLDDDSARSATTAGTSRKSADGGVRRNLADDLAVLDKQPEDLRSIHMRRVSQLSNNGIEYGDTQDLDDLGTPSSQDILTREPSASDTAVLSHSDASHFQSSGLGGRNLSVGSAGSLVDTAELKAALTRNKSNKSLESRQSTKENDNSSRNLPNRKTNSSAAGVAGKQRTLMAGKWQKNFTEGTSGAKVDDLLHVSSLQRLARERIVEMQILETDNTFELVWHIPLNGSASKISKTDRYLKNGEVVEAARRDGRPGLLRSQLTFTPEGHVHIRALQGEPFSAVFHDRIKLSTGGRRIKFEQKFQLLQPGIAPVKYYSIWHRIE